MLAGASSKVREYSILSWRSVSRPVVRYNVAVVLSESVNRKMSYSTYALCGALPWRASL